MTVTEQDTRRLIKLRAANEVLFTGRRNAAKTAWKLVGFSMKMNVNDKAMKSDMYYQNSLIMFVCRAILKELGLLGKVSTYQVAKKWDNLKRRYKVNDQVFVCC